MTGDHYDARTVPSSLFSTLVRNTKYSVGFGLFQSLIFLEIMIRAASRSRSVFFGLMHPWTLLQEKDTVAPPMKF